jgi:hypothetical protein
VGDGVNRYGYCHGNSIVLSDLSGMAPPQVTDIYIVENGNDALPTLSAEEQPYPVERKKSIEGWGTQSDHGKAKHSFELIFRLDDGTDRSNHELSLQYRRTRTTTKYVYEGEERHTFHSSVPTNEVGKPGTAIYDQEIGVQYEDANITIEEDSEFYPERRLFVISDAPGWGAYTFNGRKLRERAPAEIVTNFTVELLTPASLEEPGESMADVVLAEVKFTVSVSIDKEGKVVSSLDVTSVQVRSSKTNQMVPMEVQRR